MKKILFILFVLSFTLTVFAQKTITGLINDGELVEEVLVNKDADLVALGRELLRNPYFVNQLLALDKQLNLLPESYLRAYK